MGPYGINAELQGGIPSLPPCRGREPKTGGEGLRGAEGGGRGEERGRGRRGGRAEKGRGGRGEEGKGRGRGGGEGAEARGDGGFKIVILKQNFVIFGRDLILRGGEGGEGLRAKSRGGEGSGGERGWRDPVCNSARLSHRLDLNGLAPRLLMGTPEALRRGIRKQERINRNKRELKTGLASCVH